MFFLGGMTMGYLDPPVRTDRREQISVSLPAEKDRRLIEASSNPPENECRRALVDLGLAYALLKGWLNFLFRTLWTEIYLYLLDRENKNISASRTTGRTRTTEATYGRSGYFACSREPVWFRTDQEAAHHAPQASDDAPRRNLHRGIPVRRRHGLRRRRIIRRMISVGRCRRCGGFRLY